MEENALNQKELTFEDIFKLIKKGWVRVLVYCLVGVILATSIMVVVRAVTSPVEYTTKVSFTVDSINSNNNWMPSTSIIEIVKSDIVIRAAMDDCGFTKEKQDSMLSSGLKANIGVSTVSTMTDAKGNEYPSAINVAIRKNNKLDLSKSQYESILKYIVKNALDYIKSSYSYNVSFDTQISEDYKLNNYLQIYSRLSSYLANCLNYTESMPEEVLIYNSSSTKTNIKLIKERLSSLNNELEAIYSYLATKAVANNSTTVSSSELSFATTKVASLSEEESILSSRVAKYAELLQNVKPVINNYASGDVSINTEYYKYLEIYNNLQEQYSEVKIELAKWQGIKTAYDSQDDSEAANTAIQNMINNFVDNYNEIGVLLEETITDYNANGVLSSVIYEQNAIQKEVGEVFGMKVILMVDVAVLVVLFIVSLYVTNQKEKKFAASRTENKKIGD